MTISASLHACLKPYLLKLRNGKDLPQDDMAEAMRSIMAGEATDAQIGAFLMGLSAKGETVDEIVGAVSVLREKVQPVKAPENAVDCCGTGGDGMNTYNISTAVALVAASCGVPVAKHGNRAASSASGAADVLEALGVSLIDDQKTLEHALAETGFCFLMAPHHHQAVRHAVPARKQIGFRNIFNLIGPMANPADTKMQLIGVFDQKWLRPMAETLKRLGTKSAWIVHGDDGLDEITLATTTQIVELRHGDITERTISPHDFDLPYCEPEDLKGGDANYNAEALMDVLKGADNAYSDIVCANTAAILYLSGNAEDLKTGVQKAKTALKQGDALKILNRYISITNSAKA